MNSRRNRTYDNFNRKEITYDGRVYCVTMPKGTIVVKTGRDVWVCGNCSSYRKPHELEDAISPSLPDFGFSLVVYLSTFEDKRSDYFLEKIKIAMEEPDDWTLIFTPWFEMYPEQFSGIPLNSIGLTDYDQKVILPALIEAGVDQEKFGDYLDWYHRKSRITTVMFNEYPTTLDEVIKRNEDNRIFPDELLALQEPNLEDGQYYRLSTDIHTREVVATPVESSPLKIYRVPRAGRRYVMTVDPIVASNEDSDYFAASVWDRDSHEQVATLLGRNRPIEDWADYVYALALLYNRAIICPESNIAQSLFLLIWAKGYYNWWYPDEKARAKREPGLRTTATSKEAMLDRLILLMKSGRIIIHDKTMIDQMRTFVRRVKKDGSAGKIEAKKGNHDDLCSVAWIYAGMLDKREVVGYKSNGWAV